jgi:pyridoxine 4-dehydrogenase
MEPRHHVLGPATVSRIGFGAMQLPGPGVFGPPRDRDAAIAVLRRAADLGVDHIDTAQYYGPGVANELIRAALHPYPAGLALVSKVGARRDASGGVLRYDRPAQLRQGIEDNLRSLAVDHLAVVNLRLMDDAAPDQQFDDQLAAMAKARDDGLIGGIGLSNVTRDHLRHALAVTDIACVQNLMNLAQRESMPVLEECHARGTPSCRSSRSARASAAATRPWPARRSRTPRRAWAAPPPRSPWPGCLTCAQRSS